MNTKATSKVTLIVLSLCAFVSLAAWVFLTYKSIQTRKEIVSIAADARDKSTESAYLSSVRNTLRDAKADLAAMDARFITEEQVPGFINILEDESSLSGIQVDLGSINIEKDKGTERKVLKVRIAGAGRWEKVVGFIAHLDALPYVSRIDNVSFIKYGGSDLKNATTTWNFNLDFVQFIK